MIPPGHYGLIFCLTIEHLFCILINALIRRPPMSNNFAISSPPSTNYYHNQLTFALPREGIRSSSFRVTNMASLRTSIPHLDKLHEGRIEPHLNGFSILAKAFELDSNRSNTAVNKGKVRPPQTLCTFNVEGAERSLRSINQHFLSPFTNQLITQSPIIGSLGPQLTGFLILAGRGRVGVELLTHCRKLPLISIDLLQKSF